MRYVPVRLLCSCKLILGILLLSIFSPNTSAKADYVLTVLHVNDLHSRILPINKYNDTCDETDLKNGKCFGGYARIAKAIKDRQKKLNSQRTNNILLHAGDDFEGSIFYARYRGQAAVDLLNKIGFDAMALGNHEFDAGPGVLRRFIAKANFPILSANTIVSKKSVLYGKIAPYALLNRRGEEVAIIGAITEDTKELTNIGDQIEFTEVTQVLKKTITALEAKGINKIILLSHLGFSRDKQVAESLTGIDLIVGGHSKTLLANNNDKADGPYPVIIRNPNNQEVPIVQAYGYGKYYGEIKLVFDDLGELKSFSGDSVLLDQTFGQDEIINSRIEKLNSQLDEIRKINVGEAATFIDGTRKSCRTGECTMGNLVTDIMLWRLRKRDVDVAIQNGGGLRASIDAGEVSWGDVLTVLPFQNNIVVLQIKGKHIITALENGFSQAEDLAGRFPQISGMRVIWNPKEKAGQRVVRVEIGNSIKGYRSLNMEEFYLVATNNYLFKGGDGYDVFHTHSIDSYTKGPLLEDAMADYFTENSPIKVNIQGRIQVKEE